jgi:hypothetical protein
LSPGPDGYGNGLSDVPFRSAGFSARHEPTGVGDQLAGRDYGDGFRVQRFLKRRRLFAALPAQSTSAA